MSTDQYAFFATVLQMRAHIAIARIRAIVQITPRGRAMAAWSGLEDDVAAIVEQRLCRLQNRRLLFGGNDSGMLGRSGTPGQIGYLVNATFKAIEELVPKDDGPKKAKVAEELLKGKSAAADFSRFLNGKQAGNQWIARGRSALSYLVAGQKAGNAGSASSVANRIDRYFFRGMDKGVPRFFDPVRADSVNAWSYTELFGEIRWLARERQGGVWYVSGGVDFFQGDDDDKKEWEDVVGECADAGLGVSFIYPRGSSAAVSSLNGFAHATKTTLMEATDGNHAGTSSFITPSTRYLLLQHRNSEESALWLLRPKPSEHFVERLPIAYRCTGIELSAFQEWLTGFRGRSDLGSPGPDVVPGGPGPTSRSIASRTTA